MSIFTTDIEQDNDVNTPTELLDEEIALVVPEKEGIITWKKGHLPLQRVSGVVVQKAFVSVLFLFALGLLFMFLFVGHGYTFSADTGAVTGVSANAAKIEKEATALQDMATGGVTEPFSALEVGKLIESIGAGVFAGSTYLQQKLEKAKDEQAASAEA